MEAWFDNPKVLFENKNDALKFWPTSRESVAERVNSTTRFIIYICLAIFIIRRDPRVIMLGAGAIGVLYAFYKSDMIQPAVRPAQADGRLQTPGRSLITHPTLDNPMGNVLMSDYAEYPDRPPAAFYPTVEREVKSYLHDSVPRDAADVWGTRNQAATRFYSMPSTTIPNDQTGFAEFAYGPKFKPMCRDDSAFCDPNFWGVQPEAFAGLDPSGDKRGIRGGTVASS